MADGNQEEVCTFWLELEADFAYGLAEAGGWPECVCSKCKPVTRVETQHKEKED